MHTIQLGDQGEAVRALQTALQAAGFPPGLLDGEFGAGTEAAVLGYQRSQRITLADGRAGPETLRALHLPVPLSSLAPSAIERFDVQVVARMFPSAPLAHIQTYLPYVLDAMQVMPDRTMLLMALATIRAETAGFEPIDEGVSRYNTSPRGHAFDLYDNRHDLGNRGAPDGASYRGRGFVQLTGRLNYVLYGGRLGLPLAEQPELANLPRHAARLLACFIGDHERAIRQAVQDNDLRTARRLVNGGSHGLEAFADAWRIGEAYVPDAD